MNSDLQKVQGRSKMAQKRAHFPMIWRGAVWSGILFRYDGVPTNIRNRIAVPINLSDRVSKAASVRFVE